MTAERTDRLALPLLQAGQAQKEISHNEALVRLDMLAMPVAQAIVDTPPADPVPGSCWLVGGAPTGAFEGRAGAIAGWHPNAWRFATPREGFQIYVLAEECHAIFRGAAWQLGIVVAREFRIGDARMIAAPQPAIARPESGEMRDIEARFAVDAIISVLEAHGLIHAA